MDASTIIAVINLLLSLALMAALIYLYVYVFREVTALNLTQLEMKSKIGGLASKII